jgi:aminopeptidase N
MKVVFSAILFLMILTANSYAQMPEYKGSYHDLAISKKATMIYQFATADSIHTFDVLAYNFNLTVSNELLSGNVNIRFRAVDNNMSQIELHFIDMTVDSILQANNPIPFSRAGGMLHVNLMAPLISADSTNIQVFYHGTPTSGFYFSTNSYGQAMWYTSTEPSDARYWFPCWDEPWDKAFCDMVVSGPNSMKFTGNGRLAGSWDGPGIGQKTWHWVESYPISTYLISLAACDYAVLQDSVLVAGSYLPLIDYVYHADSAHAVYDFGNVGAMISFYSQMFGDYPFLGEKYSMSESRIFTGYGAMENQTNTTFGDGLITGGRPYEWIVAHELGHMWFGDKTTCLDWRNIWLNEGFATYLDALFTEHFYGQNSFLNRMSGFRSQYYGEDSYRRYPVYDPPPDYIFGEAEYEKGAWVLNMLRHIMGDSSFFAAMRTYSNTFAYGNASTADFQNIMENQYGSSLDWYFGEWIYDQGYPIYNLGWAVQPYNGSYNVILQLVQSQYNAPVFNMPIDFQFQGIDNDTTITLWNNQVDQYFSIFLPSIPGNIIFDPGGWILRNYPSTLSVIPRPYIDVATNEITDNLILGDVDTLLLPIGNAGNGIMNYFAVGDDHWMNIFPEFGPIGPGQIDTLKIAVFGFLAADTTINIRIVSDDPDHPTLFKPVHLIVTGTSILPGDANNSGQVNGIDVVYLVNYFKGLGPSPTPFLQGDCNGDCSVNGLDVTYLVNYLKGLGSAPFAGSCR